MDHVTADKLTRSAAELRKERCQRTHKYLTKYIEDRDSRDRTERDIWWQFYCELRQDCWWTFKNLEHWIRDRDFKKENTDVFFPYQNPDTGLWGPIRNYPHRPHRGVGGLSSDCAVSRSEGATAHYREKLGNVPQEVNETTDIKELDSFGVLEYGYGKWLRLVLKEGKYGKFLSLEAGDTIASKGDDGEVITDTRVKSWFNLPTEDEILVGLQDMIAKASDHLVKPAL